VVCIVCLASIVGVLIAFDQKPQSQLADGIPVRRDHLILLPNRS
jgi:hypothetical protein